METLKDLREAWIQGNLITFEKPTFHSVFFDTEHILVMPFGKNLLQSQKEGMVEKLETIHYDSHGTTELWCRRKDVLNLLQEK